jgi:hypothetical protein
MACLPFVPTPCAKTGVAIAAERIAAALIIFIEFIDLLHIHAEPIPRERARSGMSNDREYDSCAAILDITARSVSLANRNLA